MLPPESEPVTRGTPAKYLSGATEPSGSKAIESSNRFLCSRGTYCQQAMLASSDRTEPGATEPSMARTTEPSESATTRKRKLKIEQHDFDDIGLEANESSVSVQDNTALEKEEERDLVTFPDTGSGSTQPPRQKHRGASPAGDDPDEAHLRVLFREGMVASGMRLSRTSIGESICSIEDVFVAAKRVLLPGDGASGFTAKRGYVNFAQFPGRVHRLENLNFKRVNLRELSAVTFTDY